MSRSPPPRATGGRRPSLRRSRPQQSIRRRTSTASDDAWRRVRRRRRHPARIARRARGPRASAMAILSPYFLSVSNFLNILLATSVIGVLADRHDLRHLRRPASTSRSARSSRSRASSARCSTSTRSDCLGRSASSAASRPARSTGAVNGLLIAKGGIPAFIVTLGMLGVARGLALVLTNGVLDLRAATRIVCLGQGRPFGVPTPVDRPSSDRARSRISSRPHPLRQIRAGHRRQRGRGARHGRARRAPAGAALHPVRAARPASPGCCSPPASIPATRRRGLNYELTAITATILGGTNLFGGRASIVGHADRRADHGRAAERAEPARGLVLLSADGDRHRAGPRRLARPGSTAGRGGGDEPPRAPGTSARASARSRRCAA